MSFDWCLAWVLDREGGYVNDPADHGGATNKGITQRAYDAWLIRHGQTPLDVEYISDVQIAAVYKEDYWNEVIGDEIGKVSRNMALCVFDAAVQSSPVIAARTFQRVARSTPDGRVGKITLSCYRLRKMDVGDPDLLEQFMERRRGFYAAIVHRDPSQGKFANGWRNRRNALRETIGLEAEAA